ncbi:uncharacterized protein LOC119350838 [Triticum dicoccoides]|uniref:uncharacterized protein LOC119350838 n=1 Tax=Triticum dicoccoides TaxID=85692 RepID=UPI00188E780B|nr:uncharacterized protein LOC119350838 [Triticum dicoccoides]
MDAHIGTPLTPLYSRDPPSPAAAAAAAAAAGNPNVGSSPLSVVEGGRSIGGVWPPLAPPVAPPLPVASTHPRYCLQVAGRLDTWRPRCSLHLAGRLHPYASALLPASRRSPRPRHVCTAACTWPVAWPQCARATACISPFANATLQVKLVLEEKSNGVVQEVSEIKWLMFGTSLSDSSHESQHEQD